MAALAVAVAMDGFAVAAELRRDPRTSGARLIAVSGYSQEEDRRRCRGAGLDLHLTKPVDIALIRQALSAPGTLDARP